MYAKTKPCLLIHYSNEAAKGSICFAKRYGTIAETGTQETQPHIRRDKLNSEPQFAQTLIGHHEGAEPGGV
jgi:hypothetical protein